MTTYVCDACGKSYQSCRGIFAEDSKSPLRLLSGHELCTRCFSQVFRVGAAGQLAATDAEVKRIRKVIEEEQGRVA